MHNDSEEALPRRQALIALAGLAGLSGCASANRSAFWGTLTNFNRPASTAIDRAKVDATPYASMLAKFDGNGDALLVLGEYLPDQRLVWYSAEHQSLTTWGPFVTRLLGLEVSLVNTAFQGGWTTDLRSMAGRRVERTLDYQAQGRLITVKSKSKFELAGDGDVEILGERKQLELVKESVVANGRHHYSNKYWIDRASGFCWKSEQHVVPTMPKFNIAITRPPSAA